MQASIAQIPEAREDLEERIAALTAQVEAVNNELNEFAYVVSHDLKAPLRAVSQLARWLAEDHADTLNEDGKEMINLMLGRLDRMHNLIEGVLQYSRIGRIREQATDVDLNALVRQVIETLAPPENVRITMEKSLPTVTGERSRIQQVFQHLIGNAVKFMDKPNGEVKISVEDENGHWKFSVADNGPGIDKADHEKIFKIFQTLAARDEVEGTGMGLTLVKKIVELSGGRIWLESEVGKGSTFFFILPKTGGTN